MFFFVEISLQYHRLYVHFHFLFKKTREKRRKTSTIATTSRGKKSLIPISPYIYIFQSRENRSIYRPMLIKLMIKIKFSFDIRQITEILGIR